ncbi:MAG: SufS family cysteine desulfurase [Bacteroidetes bacterium]|jgi:cysteine desulfurase/selenocysteine lyase|nr:SufS family cysteine desulfurase [Bacteroidota bacterium]MDA0829348.1 SufS family cysteine desulfurase [Bacteroidota bacterium]MDA1200003.1 SufS family cysteine desulfurase [Bacteroidota bacterium]
MTPMLSDKIRSDFPILTRQVHGKSLVYLDNAATTQKPQAVIDALVGYYSGYNSNVHRGVHQLSQEATDAFEAVRRQLQEHLHAAESHEIILTKGTTDSLNLVAHGFRSILKPEDEIIVTQLEHHSNLVPWQMLAQHTGATLRYVPIDGRGVLDQTVYQSLLSERTKLVAFNHISNALGTINPVKAMTAAAHAVGAVVVVDGAQALPHCSVDVQDLDVDFYAGSAHKMYGPTGVGLLYGKTAWLETLPPYQGGGEMISEVAMEQSSYAGLPHKFEAGTPNIAGVIGWGAALSWMQQVGLEAIEAHEQALLAYGTERLLAIPGVKIYGVAPEKAAVLSFNVAGVHPYDVGTLLDQMGIAVRTGQHCTQPIMDCFGIPGTIRASLAAYTSREDLDALAHGLEKAIALLV